MKNNFLLRDEFIEWMVKIAKFPLPSAQSYCSYVAAADKYVNFNKMGIDEEMNLFSLLEILVANGNEYKMDAAIIAVIDYLSEKDIDKSLNVPISSINKWRSGLFQYREFLYYYIEKDAVYDDVNPDDVTETDTDEEDVNIMLFMDESIAAKKDKKKAGKTYVYSKKDLYKIFHFRIITQDRFYNDIFYPISFIKRYFYLKGEKEFLDTWVQKLLDNVNVHLPDGAIKLNQITALHISSDHAVIAYYHNLVNHVLTREADNVSLNPLSVKKLREIAIDHDKPLLNIMYENMDSLKIFQMITNELKKYISGKVNPQKLKLANNCVLNSDFIQGLNIEVLKSEMQMISSHTNLQLMESRRNSAKGSFYSY